MSSTILDRIDNARDWLKRNGSRHTWLSDLLADCGNEVRMQSAEVKRLREENARLRAAIPPSPPKPAIVSGSLRDWHEEMKGSRST